MRVKLNLIVILQAFFLLQIIATLASRPSQTELTEALKYFESKHQFQDYIHKNAGTKKLKPRKHRKRPEKSKINVNQLKRLLNAEKMPVVL